MDIQTSQEYKKSNLRSSQINFCINQSFQRSIDDKLQIIAYQLTHVSDEIYKDRGFECRLHNSQDLEQKTIRTPYLKLDSFIM